MSSDNKNSNKNNDKTVEEKTRQGEADAVELTHSQRIGALIHALLREVALDVYDKSPKEMQPVNVLLATLYVISEITERTVAGMSLSAYGDKPEMIEIAKMRLFLAGIERTANNLQMGSSDVYRTFVEQLVVAEHAFVRSGVPEESIRQTRQEIERKTFAVLQAQEEEQPVREEQ